MEVTLFFKEYIAWREKH